MTRFLNKEIVNKYFCLDFLRFCFMLMCFPARNPVSTGFVVLVEVICILDLVGNTGSCDLLFPVWDAQSSKYAIRSAISVNY